MSWQYQILRVNLTDLNCTVEPLNEEWAQSYLGQRGLGTRYLYEEIDPRVDPVSPENKLIFATGPLTGTMASTGGRYSVITKGALTNAIACSNSGGQFGAELKLAGYDLLILEGKAPEPVYLHIENEQVRLLPAKQLWGKTVWETEEIIKQTHQDPLIHIASVGPSAEYGCRFACVVNDMHRAAGRSGVGTVMGSKGLKAIAVRGTKGVSVEDPAAFMRIATETAQAMRQDNGRKALTGEGTISMMDTTNVYGSLPTRNFRDVQFEDADKIGLSAMKTANENGHVNLVANSACFGCTIGCGRVCHIDPAHFSVKDKPQYHGASGGLEYETAYALGSAVGVGDIDAATYCGFLCNEYGMDPISLGGSISAAMELFDIGAIDESVTGGIKLEFGSAEALCAMTEAVARGEGVRTGCGHGIEATVREVRSPRAFDVGQGPGIRGL